MTRILVIEDVPQVREQILEILRVAGFDTVEADNGRIGLRLAREHTPDLILCDVMMP
jgi:CheY-like chemotaxis protein